MTTFQLFLEIAQLVTMRHPERYVAGIGGNDFHFQFLWNIKRYLSLGVHMPLADTPFRQATMYVLSFSLTSWTEEDSYYLPI